MKFKVGQIFKYISGDSVYVGTLDIIEILPDKTAKMQFSELKYSFDISFLTLKDAIKKGQFKPINSTLIKERLGIK